MKARNVLAASFAAALSVGAVNSAEAAYAWSYMDITNFAFSGPAYGSPPTVATFSYRSTASSDRHNLTGCLSDETGSTPVSAGECATPGSAGLGDSSKAQRGKVQDYGRGTANIPSTSSAWALAEAYSPPESTEQTHTGNGFNSLEFTLTAAADGALQVSFDYIVAMIAEVLPLDGSSTTSVQFGIAVDDLTNAASNVASFLPGNLNNSFTFTDVDSDTYGVMGSITNASLQDNNAGGVYQFMAGDEYRVKVNMSVDSSASQVGERVPLPGTVALMGLGLAGFGAARRVAKRA